jgi:hypothetical protein
MYKSFAFISLLLLVCQRRNTSELRRTPPGLPGWRHESHRYLPLTWRLTARITGAHAPTALNGALLKIVNSSLVQSERLKIMHKTLCARASPLERSIKPKLQSYAI